MLKNIVVPLDGSEYSWSAAQYAIQMAHPHRATIYGVYAIDAKIIQGDLMSDLNIKPEVAKGLYQDKGRKILEDLEKKCSESGVKFQPVMDVSAVTNLVRKTASQIKAELIVMGRKGVNAPWTGPLLGSTAESTVRWAKRPVFFAQDVYTPIKKVYVCYDGELVSIRALRFTADLCARCKWEMSVISIHYSKERREKLLNEAREMAELHQLKTATIGRSGDATEQILDATSGDPNALIAVGAYSSHLRRLILGSVSEEIMRRASQPVLIYRPPS